MTVLLMSVLIAAGAFAAGLLGALTGLGGGIIVGPMLTLAFGIDLHYAVGASLISVIATSSGAAAAYVREGYTNIRVGMLLEVATTLGALVGVYLAVLVSANFIAVLFAIVLLSTAIQSLRPQAEHLTESSSPLARRLRLASTYPTPAGLRHYEVTGVPLGFCIMFLAGALSALLGIGSGVVKVLAMDRIMRLPFKVSTTTSNFMIGVTGAASAGVYLSRGYIEPTLAFPTTIGVLAGALVGARLLTLARTRALRLLFTTVIVLLAIEMLYKGIKGAM
ncbi:MAG TPA: sulfite exporter TauE/SafE family protein [Gemmatimonadales bacterium]|nr:sulfite exporter TauE/SafE family protein [Gemmatimonadales bacterium]